MSDIATGQDADFSEERFVERYNTDLANSLGNLLNRTLAMAEKYRAGLLRTDVEYKTHLKMFMDFEQLPSDSKGLLKKPEYIPILDHAASVINAVRGFTHEMDRFAFIPHWTLRPRLLRGATRLSSEPLHGNLRNRKRAVSSWMPSFTISPNRSASSRS